jgi:hypothetical protein
VYRIRRVKCDEETPSCRRCISTGRNCEGPETAFVRGWSITTKSSFPPPSISLLPKELRDDQAQSSFEFFRLVSIGEFGNYFNNHFWSRTLLQATHASGAVQHAVLAVASLHRSFKYNGRPRSTSLTHGAINLSAPYFDRCYATSPHRYNPYSVQQYGKALRHLVHDISQPPGGTTYETAVICIVLFVLIEVLYENDFAALSHLDSGIKLLQQSLPKPYSMSSTKSSPSDVQNELFSIFSLLDLEASIYQGIRKPYLYRADIEFGDNGSQLEHGLQRLESLYKMFRTLMSELLIFQRTLADEYRYRTVGNVPLEVFAQQQALCSKYLEWEHKANHLRNQCVTDTGSDELSVKRRALLLGVHYSLLLTIALCCLNAEETAFDNQFERFDNIVRCATELLKHHARANVSAQESSLSLGTWIIPALYWTVKKCRSGQLRRRAVELLRRCPREGVWIAEIQARVAERVIEIEEAFVSTREASGSNSELSDWESIPEAFRIHSVDVTPDKENRLIMMTYQRRLNGLDGEWDITTEWLAY